MSQPIATADTPSLAAAPAPLTDLYVWIFALIPLGGLLELAYGAVTHDALPDRLASAVYYAAYIALALTDTKMLKAARLPRVPSPWWSLLAPAYLVARARALGRGWNYVWIWLIAFGVYLGTYMLPSVNGTFAMLAPTPACAGDFDADVLGMFDRVPQVQAAHIQGSGLTNRTQTSKLGAKRFCQAHVATNAPNGKGNDISYSFDRQPGGQVYLRVRLLN